MIIGLWFATELVMGKKRKTLVFDYWKDKGGEECYEEFRNKYTNKDEKKPLTFLRVAVVARALRIKAWRIV